MYIHVLKDCLQTIFHLEISSHTLLEMSIVCESQSFDKTNNLPLSAAKFCQTLLVSIQKWLWRHNASYVIKRHDSSTNRRLTWCTLIEGKNKKENCVTKKKISNTASVIFLTYLINYSKRIFVIQSIFNEAICEESVVCKYTFETWQNLKVNKKFFFILHILQ